MTFFETTVGSKQIYSYLTKGHSYIKCYINIDRWIVLSCVFTISLGAQRGLFIISSTKGLGPLMYRRDMWDPRMAFLKFQILYQL